ncbi:MAG: DUF1003 domain-containing protein [Pyrinomonadaceae bacterium]|nr:DUF1003 domain-containing protein [Blastocatellia bacterium]MCW5958336.1 DUF1003 domain-containing protein [Pyrinomonadaceae bacterium]
MEKRTNETIEDHTKHNIQKVVEIEQSHLKRRTFGERLAEKIAVFSGSTWFAILNLVWFVGWIGFNVAAPDDLQFDPYPFTFLTLMVSLEAIFLSVFILIAQNQEARLTEHRDHLDLQINLLAEQENTKMLELLEAIAEKVGIESDHEAIRALKEPAEPEKLSEQIENFEKGKVSGREN